MNINSFGVLCRYFGSISVLYKNHYDALGITPKATQGEIKAAFYKLSMLYHPDRNKGSDSANEKFKDITAAYEVLGNFKSRRHYDRGLGVVSDAPLRSWEPGNSEGSKVPTTRGAYTGRSHVYDFDEWSRLHYGEALERRAHAKARYEEKVKIHGTQKRTVEKENFMFSVLILLSFFFIFSYAYSSRHLDSPIDESSKVKPR